MENFVEKLKEIKTFNTSIGKEELESLAFYLSTEYGCIEELESKLLLFFSLNSDDVKYLLKLMRRNSANLLKDDKIAYDFFQNNEKLIDSMVEGLNQYSIEKTKLPFHLSAALGKLIITKEMANSFKINIQELIPKESNKLAKGDCPYGDYPRYVSYVLPWKLRTSFHISIYQRKEDVGCHFQHGPFDGVIKGWFSWSATIITMVLLQGWGFKLAANNNHLFYKWWFVVAVGLTPYHCMMMLYVRKY